MSSSNNEKLSGIERQLVLQYLIDANVPVTITPLTNKETEHNDEKIHSIDSQIFPIALRAENIKANKDGKIFLENPPQAVIGFENKEVKVEFYFNRVGLYFTQPIKKEGNSLYFELPQVINRIKDEEEKNDYDFSAILYFEFKNKKNINKTCIPWTHNELFTRPVWKSIPLENQKKAKELLEHFVNEAKQEKNIGNGIQLIPICNFLTFEEPKKIEALENRVKPINILYVDHERIVFALEQDQQAFETGCEFGLKMSFSLKNSPILSRDVFVSIVVNKVYKGADKGEKLCADCVYTVIQEEDVRYLYEKVTKIKFL